MASFRQQHRPPKTWGAFRNSFFVGISSISEFLGIALAFGFRWVSIGNVKGGQTLQPLDHVQRETQELANDHQQISFFRGPWVA